MIIVMFLRVMFRHEKRLIGSISIGLPTAFTSTSSHRRTSIDCFSEACVSVPIYFLKRFFAVEIVLISLYDVNVRFVISLYIILLYNPYVTK